MSRKIAVYVCVSSKQRDQRSQETELRHWLAGKADADVTWYRDIIAGKTIERPGMERLQADIAAGRIGCIVVWRLDRLGRTARGLSTLFQDLQQRGVNLVSLKDSLDLSTPAGRLMTKMLASVAACEAEVRAERVLAGQAAARAAGKKWGGSSKGRRLKVTQERVAVIWKMHGESSKIIAMARATGLSRPTIHAVLKEPRPKAG